MIITVVSYGPTPLELNDDRRQPDVDRREPRASLADRDGNDSGGLFWSFGLCRSLFARSEKRKKSYSNRDSTQKHNVVAEKLNDSTLRQYRRYDTVRTISKCTNVDSVPSL